MSYCNHCKANTDTLDIEIKQTKNNRFYSTGICDKCGFKKIRFIKAPTQGDGIIQNIKAAIKGPRRDRYTPKVRALMNKLKDDNIVGITIGRDPISPGKILNILTLGSYNKAVKNLGYDNLFHLYAVLTLENSERYRVEKNEVIRMRDYEPDETPNESIEIPMNNPIRWEDFFLNAKDYHEKYVGNYFLYNMRHNNCQKYITSLLKGNDLGSPEDFKFINQDAVGIMKQLEGDQGQENAESQGGILSKLGDFATDLGARLDILREGEGKQKRKNKKSK